MTRGPDGAAKAVIFDLDGTLIDSAPDLRVALNHLLAEEGRRSLDLEAVKMMIGDGVQKLVERGFAATGEAAESGDLAALTERYLGFYEGHAADLTRPYPGAAEALAGLREAGYGLGICTNKPYAATLEILEELDLAEYFQAVAGGDSVPGARKPDPRHLLAVVEGLGARPETAVMVGDNKNDVNAARGAGMAVIVVSFGYPKMPIEELGADLIIEGFADLPGAIARLP
jgi:phosphoglycolate phosphatase